MVNKENSFLKFSLLLVVFELELVCFYVLNLDSNPVKPQSKEEKHFFILSNETH